MNEVLISSVIDKVEEQQKIIMEQKKAIGQLEEKVEQLPDHIELLNKIKAGIEKVQTALSNISFPQKEMRELSERLITSTMLLKQPVKQEVIQRHHVPKIVWITAALFLLFCLVLSRWYNTYDKLDLYKANDTKYRYLKLRADKYLNYTLDQTDSLYKADDKMREKVMDEEEQNQRNFETMQKALQMEKEAKELKSQVQDNNKKEK